MNFDKNNAKVKEMDPFACEINDLIVKSKHHQRGQSLFLHEDQKFLKPEFNSKSGIGFIPQHELIPQYEKFHETVHETVYENE